MAVVLLIGSSDNEMLREQMLYVCTQGHKVSLMWAKGPCTQSVNISGNAKANAWIGLVPIHFAAVAF